ncbi:DUF4870 domain-containing protein [Nodosilinea sp. LEGE 06152]|uniref:DUF4870 domain-containing protein n=1 Tax=Nodosilinea sp. LEGE 06152 TaxID=2777966 RepID=UPI00187F32DD|nr:DUF4870 domain-containing protein [Nodosilinea sp. LEGE 06152]MBE9158883.1 DUF4870 domain-containing protein [Nodosilinea sp. LEGE 06152]
MTNPLSTLIARARQGDARAIARLITRSLAAQGVVAQGQWQGTQLYLDLESEAAIDQRQVVPQLRRGLLRLGLTCPVDTVWVTARRVGWAEAAWREGFSLDGAVFSPTDMATTPLDAAGPISPATGPGAAPEPALTTSDRFDDGFTTDRSPPDPVPETALSDTTLVALAHLAPVLSYLVLGSQWLGGWPLFWGGSFLLPCRVVAPLVLLLVKGTGASAATNAAYVQHQAKAALNFQLTMFIAWVVTLALMFVLVGFLLVVPLALLEIVSCIVAAVRASEGKPVRYAAIRFVR